MRLIISLLFAASLYGQGAGRNLLVSLAGSGGGGGPAFIQACSAYTAASASPTCLFGGSNTSGNVIAGMVNVASSSSAVTITSISCGSFGGTVTTFNANTSFAGHTTLFTCPLTGTGATTITATLSGSSNDTQIFAQEISGVTGVDNSQTGMVNASGCTGATGCNATTLTPTGSTDYLFVAGTDSGNFNGGTVTAIAAVTIPTGAGTSTCVLTPGGYHGSCGYQVMASSSAVTPWMKWSASMLGPLADMLLK